jgi:hypothetical protein
MERINTQQRSSDLRGRNHRRFRLEFPVRLRFKRGSITAEIEAVSKNLSVSGLLVRSLLSVPEHTAVTFVLSVHGSQSLRPVHLRGEGEIVRVESVEPEGTFIMAVKCDAPVAELEEYLPT